MIESEFWLKLEKTDSCWNWTGATNGKGYGKVRWANAKNNQYAHRIAWRLTRGDIPTGMCVLHRCDNRRCCNPDHLFPGTPADNTRDMIEKGRSRIVRGESARSKLTENLVREIRQLRARGVSGTELSRRYGVSRNQIWMIVSRRHWGHV